MRGVNLTELAIFLSCLEISILMMWFHAKLYGQRYGKELYIVVTVGVILFRYGISMTKHPIMNVGAFLGSVVITSLLFKNNNDRKKYINNLYFVTIFLLTDRLISTLWEFLYQHTQQQVSSDRFHFATALIILLVNLVVCNVLVRKLMRYKLGKVEWREIIRVFLIGIFQLVILISLVIFENRTGYDLTFAFMLFGTGCLIITLYEFYTNRMRESYHQELRKREVERNNNILLKENYKSIEEKNERYKKMEHDIQKHLSVIEQLANEGEKEIVNDYIESIKREIEVLQGPYIYKNKTLQVIINEIYHKCKKMNITYELHVMDVELNFLDVYDMTILLGNILNNAIEACSEISNRPTFIRVRLYEYNDYVVLQVENSSNGIVLKDKNGKILSSKGSGRGIGLKNVDSIVEKYGGSFEIIEKEENIISRAIILQESII